MTSQPTDYAQRWPDMAAHESEKPQDKIQPHFTSINGYLYTPPEHNADSFSQEVTQKQEQEWQRTAKLPPLQSQTPPTSPAERLPQRLPSITYATGYASNDEPLYPDRRADDAQSQTPLFGADRSPSIPPAVSLPSGEDVGQDTLSKLMISPAPAGRKATRSESFPNILDIVTGRQAIEFFYSRQSELKSIQKARRTTKLPAPRKSNSRERDEIELQQLRRLSRPAGVPKPRSQTKPASKPKAASVSATSPVHRTPPPRRRTTPKVKTHPEWPTDAFPADRKPHKRAPPSKKVEDNSKHWNDLPNYAPAKETLDTNPKTLKAQWQVNHPLDLSTDPDRNELHSQELAVASTLRLTGAQYLANKRKIFQAKLQAVKDGRNFTKTAAQGACAIDVNKASQLWDAFNRVGWLEDSWFEQFL